MLNTYPGNMHMLSTISVVKGGGVCNKSRYILYYSGLGYVIVTWEDVHYVLCLLCMMSIT